MQTEPGDDYIRRTASFIRTNEQRLAQSGIVRRKKANSIPSVFNPLGWVGLAESAPPRIPMVLSMDTHHLFYILMRLEALGIDVGSLDVQVDHPSRPMSYISIPGNDKAETLSIASFRSSLSAISKLSLGSSWWSRTEPPNVDVDLKYIFSSFTKLPALSIHAPGPTAVDELVKDPPGNNAVPVDAFKNVQTLECLDIDPRTLIGWDRLAESLRSLTIKRSGVQDPTTIFVDAVLEDQARREGTASKPRTRRIGHRPSRSFYGTGLPETVREESEERPASADDSPPATLSPLKWAFIKHLSLADNGLTSIPSAVLPYLKSLTHLDLSSNLLNSIPPGLPALYNLVHLNLSDNMIDSVLGIYTKLGQVLTLNLSSNRLESLCGLERLLALERIDLRHNHIDESAEIGRLAVLPHVVEVWVDDNPFVDQEQDWRVRCFDVFWQEGKTIVLDGALPTYFERRQMTAQPKENAKPQRAPSIPQSPPTLMVGAPPLSVAPTATGRLSPGSSEQSSPAQVPIAAKPKRKKNRNKRFVDIDGGETSDHRGSEDGFHSRSTTDPMLTPKNALQALPPAQDTELHLQPAEGTNTSPASSASPPSPPRVPTSPGSKKSRSRHGRSHTEWAPASPSTESPPSPTTSGVPDSPPSPRQQNFTRRSGTMSSPTARRNRVSASLYEGLPSDADAAGNQMNDADAFRARIEALRAEVGDSWLHVLSQSQFASPTSLGKVSSRG
ncbi:hypothetical protein BD410DRAFT_716202 [Rickenella mellea]|uniref:L domain-like protein n=1 Tax=Rickenella mellea TaxID=50990 RepID=A0A4Y7QGK2_9AGAM|nr:hypothetical protein BD410DRAFT_716202 [Rickenella mellea]